MPDLELEALLRRYCATLEEVEQLERDCEHWNAQNPDEPPLIADPDGDLATLLARLSAKVNAAIARATADTEED